MAQLVFCYPSILAGVVAFPTNQVLVSATASAVLGGGFYLVAVTVRQSGVRLTVFHKTRWRDLAIKRILVIGIFGQVSEQKSLGECPYQVGIGACRLIGLRACRQSKAQSAVARTSLMVDQVDETRGAVVDTPFPWARIR